MRMAQQQSRRERTGAAPSSIREPTLIRGPIEPRGACKPSNIRDAPRLAPAKRLFCPACWTFRIVWASTSGRREGSPHRLGVAAAAMHLIRKGTRRKKLEIVQFWECKVCRRVFTPAPADLRYKTYPLRIILDGVTYYNRGCSLAEAAAIWSPRW
jgi:hypothetical protein